MSDREDSVGSRDDDLLDTVAANPELARVAFLPPPSERARAQRPRWSP